MGLGASPKLISNLSSQNVATREYVCRILKISELNTVYHNVFVLSHVINKNVICFYIYPGSVPLMYGVVSAERHTCMNDILVMQYCKATKGISQYSFPHPKRYTLLGKVE